MARASWSSDEFYTPSNFGFIQKVGDKRHGEITGNLFRYVALGTGGMQATMQVLEITEIDSNGGKVGDAVQHDVIVEFAPQADANGETPLIAVRPGVADSPDEDPRDTAEDGVLVLGAEGNTLFTDDGFKYNMQLPFGILMDSFRRPHGKTGGFKPDILRRSYGPDIIGTQAVFTLIPDVKGKTDKKGNPRANLVIDQFLQYPYEKKASGKQTAAPASKPASKANGMAKPAPAPAPVSTPSAPVDEDLSMEVIGYLRDIFPEITKPTSRIAIAKRALMLGMKAHPPKSDGAQAAVKGIDAILKDANWFAENLVLLGGVNVGDDLYQSAG